ncbi:MAG: 4Fe-4S binding protein [Lachnospiraceae bacterium]|nr:4Fe-4S binding protein [Lachnospiraceae bacterium]
MLRKIIRIDSETCNGCGACASVCHEGAIEMIDGKAVLTRENYCDGLGDCLPACPVDAISFEMREAPAYDEAAVVMAKQDKEISNKPTPVPPWPVQIKLLPIQAPVLQGADLLIAADCSAYVYSRFHQDFVRGRVTLIGCPKLDNFDYAAKLTDIFTLNNIRSVTVVRMQVPCCGGLSYAVERALQASGKSIPLSIVVLSPQGQIVR